MLRCRGTPLECWVPVKVRGGRIFGIDWGERGSGAASVISADSERAAIPSYISFGIDRRRTAGWRLYGHHDLNLCFGVTRPDRDRSDHHLAVRICRTVCTIGRIVR